MLKLLLQEISDSYVRENFKRLQAFFAKRPGVEDFKAIEIMVTEAAPNFKIKHGLGLIPTDVILSRLIAPSGAKLTLNFGAFTKEEISVTTSGPLRARLLVGSFQNTLVNQPKGPLEETPSSAQDYKGAL